MTTTYCAPCLADLALVREASTAVAGTASCMAHAVLLIHPTDDPQRRRQRLAQLRDSANEKLETAGPDERLRLEILVEEYGLASAMESLVPRRRSEEGGGPTSRSARKRRGRDGRERPDGAPGQGSPQGGEGRGRGPRDGRPGGQQGGQPAGAGDQQPGSAVADGSAERQGAEALAQVGAPSGEPPAPSSGSDAPSTDAPSTDAGSTDASSAPTSAPASPTGTDAPAASPAPTSAAEPAPSSLAAETPAERPAQPDASGTPES